MSFEDKFEKLTVSQRASDHINNQLLDKFSHKIKTDELSFSKAKTSKDKSNRATVENVLDPRTMRFLKSMVNRGVIADLNGCLSTGKEANVYHAFAGTGKAPVVDEETGKYEVLETDGLRAEYAIKIYKTSILVFKDREKYVDGEFRFRNARSQHNPRKMIKIWAEKEFRNLKRIHQSGVIPAPKPVEVKNNVLVMEFLSRGDGFASPKLKDYPYKDREEIFHYYYTMVAYMRLLYQVCRLVHADLSEYNTIIHDDQLYMIDVSQSVEPEHPMSLDFLRMDIKNVNLYFEKMGINIFPERVIFQFVISEVLEKFKGDYKNVPDLIGYISKNLPIKSTEQDEAEDEIFRSLHLVRSLGGLEERDFDRYTDGKFDLLKSLIAHDNERNFAASEQFEFNDNDHGSAPESEESSGSEYEDLSGSEEDEDDSDDSEYYDDDEPKILKGKKYEDKDVKKLRKQEAKDTKREKRKTKVKKHIKKKLVKKTKSKK
ncbi:hypothetical protein N7582_002614 [Saccharomyces uvarum]|uniref:Serine/threonine-protein kinase RIO1 n=1 Tax=Saccharomyces uvarum TaxID=230603 RepID=A0AA35NTY5_SACUV|nr:hypothetical protein N7582_002614 [Saccharomyces uvarum]CAI4064213.1 hypothetical protein SUVC_08G1560 [Saccharomyces uvarum]